MLITVALAGCSDSEPAQTTTGPGPVPEDLEKGKGVIRGVVVDGALAPVAGADVVVGGTQLAAVTDDEGQFLFADVEPTTYFVTASKPGWSQVQQSVLVEADVLTPPAITLQILPIPGTEPRAPTFSQRGFIGCGAATALTIHSVCNDLELNEDRSHVYFEIPEKPDYYQAEIVWKSTQATSTQLWSAHYQYDFASDSYIDGGGPSSRLCNSASPSPYVCRVGPERLNATSVGGTVGVDIAMFADGPEGNGVAISQDFEVFLTLFYNTGEPDADYRYIEHGDYMEYAGA